MSCSPGCAYCAEQAAPSAGQSPDSFTLADGRRVLVQETVDHPSHYGGAENPHEPIKIIEYYGLGFCTGNAIKYILRAGKKPGAQELEDLKKAAWYLAREIARLEKP